MKLISLRIEKFGIFEKQNLEFTEGLNQFTKDNGWGKSTLCAFIKAMFYGMRHTTGNAFTERKKYLSFSGGRVGGSLVFEYNNKSYRIERFFQEKPSDDTFRLLELPSLKDSQDFSQNIGEELFGLDLESFEKSVFINNDHSKNPELTSSITGHLNNLLETSPSENEAYTFETIMKKLEKEILSMKSLRGSSNNRVIDRLENEIRETEKDIFIQKENLEKLKEKEKSLSQKKQDIENLTRKILEKEDLIVENQKLRQAKNGNTGFFILSICFLFLFFFGVYASLVWIKNPKIIFVLAMLPVLSCANFYVLALQKKHAGKNKKSLPSVKELLENIKEYQTVKEKLLEEKSLLEKEITELSMETERLTELEETLNQKKDEKITAEKKLSILNLTQKALVKAKENLEENYSGKLQESFSKFLNLFEKEKAFSMDSKMNVYLEAKGSLQSSAYFSDGYKDLTAFCARLSLWDCLFEKEKPFLILDDPFVNLDAKKLETAHRVLLEIAKNTQVLYFKAR